MKVSDLRDKKVVIWGLGREAKAAAQLIHQRLSDFPLCFVNEGEGGDESFLRAGDECLRAPPDIKAVLDNADIIIKSPGVSLYHPLLQGKETRVTSLLNLWIAEPHNFKTIFVTGTKGKSTTASLLAHVLNALGKKTALLGNIGVPVTEIPTGDIDYAVIETSSYQAANFTESADIGILTSLFPEHLDWHKSLAAYYRDKMNLLAHSRIKIANGESLQTAQQNNIACPDAQLFNNAAGFHVRDGQIYDGDVLIGAPHNTHLARAHNLVNICAVLTALRLMGFDAHAALPLMENFSGLPHRQQELGIQSGILFVDDSISTTPQSAIAAMEVYRDRPVTLLAGGFDRGIAYDALIDYVLAHTIHAVICMGPSGQRIYDALHARRTNDIYLAASLQDAVETAKRITPQKGVVLLSPAAPSYGMFKNFEERGRAFTALVINKE